MRARSLLGQTLVANLVLVAAAVVAAVIAVRPGQTLSPAAITVLALSVALSVALNVLLLQRRTAPLERLAEAMQSADLDGPGANVVPVSRRASVEVRHLEQSFAAMLARLEHQRREAGRAALEAQERERARIARDLHDQVNQELTGILLMLEGMRGSAPSQLRDAIDQTASAAGQAMDELVELARRLRPVALDDLGLGAALSALARSADERARCEVRFHGADGPEPPPDVQLAVYRIAQEALSNALRHSGGNHVDLTLTTSSGGVELEVRDDGVGMEAQPASESGPRVDAAGDRAGERSREPAGLGLAGMRERALLVGGTLAIQDGEAGVVVRLSIPEIEGGDAAPATGQRVVSAASAIGRGIAPDEGAKPDAGAPSAGVTTPGDATTPSVGPGPGRAPAAAGRR